MEGNFVAQDGSGNVASNMLRQSGCLAPCPPKTLPLTQGETKLVTMWLFKKNGLPLVLPGTISAAVAKIFSGINQASIQKTLAAMTLTLINSSAPAAGVVGVQFSLLAADTLSMAANNNGLPMTLTFTDSSGNVTELDFIAVFAVELPAVQT